MRDRAAILGLGFLIALKAAGPARAADPGVERFWAEATPHWLAAEADAATLQGRVTAELHTTIPDRGIDETDTVRVTVRQNPRAALLSGGLILAKPNDPTVHVFLANPRYAALLRRDSHDADRYLLREYFADPGLAYETAPANARDWAFLKLCPHYSYADIPLSRLRQQPGVEVRKVEFGPEPGSPVRATLRRVVRPNTPKVITYDAVLTFAPNRQWHLTGVEEAVNQSKGKFVTTVSTRYTIDETSPAPLPPIREQRNDSRSRSGSGTSRVARYELERREVADGEFTLAAFGLPEPVGLGAPRGTPSAVWLLLAAALAAVAAVAFRRLSRRGQPAPSPAPGPKSIA